ncbi:MAG: NADH-quinone oxidoreductase subunit N [Bacteriovoracaceae bacterium]
MGINFLATLSHYIPELMAIVTMMGLLFVEACFKNNERNRLYLYLVAGIGLLFTFWSLGAALSTKPLFIFTNSVTIDPFSTLIKMIMVLGCAGAIYLSADSEDIYSNLKAEFAIMAVGVLVGGMLLASANNLLTLYLGIETLSILSYVMSSLKKKDDRSSEAGLKYVLYGGVASGIMLFGMSHIFGALGTINFSEMILLLNSSDAGQTGILLVSFLFVFVGLGYKIACVPFHMWTPDVYEGSPIPVTTFFAIVPKMAGIAALVRITMGLFGEEQTILQISWVGVIQVAAALTMIVGNVSAIAQKSVKRMLAYSSIGHAGFMLLGVVVVDQTGASAIAFYGITYLFMTLVAFFITGYVSDHYGNDHFERFNGLIHRYPVMSIMMIITMISLAGIPPMSGFVAKFNILAAAVKKGYFTLAIIGGINSVVSLYYYLKIVRLMVFKPVESEEAIAGFGMRNHVVVIGLSIPVVALGIFWSSILGLTSGAHLLLP